jgi:hypothetical protein
MNMADHENDQVVTAEQFTSGKKGVSSVTSKLEATVTSTALPYLLMGEHCLTAAVTGHTTEHTRTTTCAMPPKQEHIMCCAVE